MELMNYNFYKKIELTVFKVFIQLFNFVKQLKGTYPYYPYS